MLRSVLKALGVVLVAGLFVATVFVVNLIGFRPFSLDHFYEKIFVALVLEQPELLSALGIAEPFGYRRHNAHLDDASVAKADRDAAKWHRHLADLKAYDVASQTPQQRLSTRVLTWFIENQIEGEKYRFHDYPVNQLFGVQSGTPDFLINVHRIADARGADDYISRLRELPRKFDQVLEGLALRERNGVVPPRFVIERVLEETRAFAGLAAEQNPLYVRFASKVDALGDIDAARKQALRDRGRSAIEDHVVPAYRKLTDFLDAQRGRATTDDGAWKLPDGDAYYAYMLRAQTTTRMTPQAVHEIGTSEVARIDAEMTALLKAQGELADGETPGAAMARLGKDPRFLYPNSDTGREAALADYARMIDEQRVRSRTLIGLAPRAAIEVRRVPEFRQATAAAAYYTAPAIDGSRPGIFFANLRDMSELPKYAMRTVAIHEGVPGHHFQNALAQELKGVPTFRTVLPFTAYGEGWALYAEWLGTELGVYDGDPYGNLGRLNYEMLRAVRLVVDTGIHHKRWTRGEAIAYMLEKTGLPEAVAVSEVERYIVSPGQACAYKLGMMSIQAARLRSQAALGETFDAQAIRDFHDVVLRNGALPLAVLDEEVDAWIASRRR